MDGAAHEKLSALPDLFDALMERPLVPLTKGRLPYTNALYVLYEDGRPLVAGSAPFLDEIRLLAPSFRGGFTLRISDRPVDNSPPPSMGRSRVASHLPRQSHAPIEARWLVVADKTQRVALEAYVLKKLGLTITHPGLRVAVGRSEMNGDAF